MILQVAEGRLVEVDQRMEMEGPHLWLGPSRMLLAESKHTCFLCACCVYLFIIVYLVIYFFIYLFIYSFKLPLCVFFWGIIYIYIYSIYDINIKCNISSERLTGSCRETVFVSRFVSTSH